MNRVETTNRSVHITVVNSEKFNEKYFPEAKNNHDLCVVQSFFFFFAETLEIWKVIADIEPFSSQSIPVVSDNINNSLS